MVAVATKRPRVSKISLHDRHRQNPAALMYVHPPCTGPSEILASRLARTNQSTAAPRLVPADERSVSENVIPPGMTTLNQECHATVAKLAQGRAGLVKTGKEHH